MALSRTKQRVMCEHGNKPIKTILWELMDRYRAHPHRMEQIALELDVGIATVYRWCREYDIEFRKPR